MEEERVAIFIDGSNLYYILKKMFRNKRLSSFDFKKFCRYLVGKRQLTRIYYYNSPLDRKKDLRKYQQQQKFFDKLKWIPNFNLILCRMQKIKIDGKVIYQVKEDDIHLAVDMVEFASNDFYDTAVLISSDGDFVPAIKAVKRFGKTVENVGFEIKFSYHLKKECDEFRMLKISEVEQFFD